jgi:ferredoxin-NADP reductase
MRARIRTISWEADGINVYALTPLAGEHFAPFTAGGHINVSLKDGLTRSYSLLNDPAQTDRYEIGVQHAPDSRGGSRHIHEVWRVGDVLEISDPRNNFPLHEDAPLTVMIAGGIGITPMLSMIARLDALGRDWRLHYVCRQREKAPFLPWLERHPKVELFFDEEPEGVRLDIQAVLASTPLDAHLYCCGPARMLAAFEDLTASRPPGHAHWEYFSAETELATDGGYTLELSRSGKTIQVEAGDTMLDALLSAGVNVGFACSEGICGTCEVRVLAGVPDHRDQFLTDEEKARNQAVMVCCSGSKTPKLVLDL